MIKKILLVFYSIVLYEMGVAYLEIHLLSGVITYIVIDGVGYLKFIG